MSGRRIGYLSFLIIHFSNNFSALGAAKRAAKNPLPAVDFWPRGCGVGI
jgi:hypothetical protein